MGVGWVGGMGGWEGAMQDDAHHNGGEISPEHGCSIRRLRRLRTSALLPHPPANASAHITLERLVVVVVVVVVVCVCVRARVRVISASAQTCIDSTHHRSALSAVAYRSS